MVAEKSIAELAPLLARLFTLAVCCPSQSSDLYNGLPKIVQRADGPRLSRGLMDATYCTFKDLSLTSV